MSLYPIVTSFETRNGVRANFLKLALLLLVVCFQPIPGLAQDVEELAAIDPSPPTSGARDVVEIRPNTERPDVVAMAALDDANVFFLNPSGQIGIAKFTPGLALIAWDYYSDLQQDVLPSLVPGRNLSVITSTTIELTQGFHVTGDFQLDFFQSIVSNWPGKKEGVVITAGPLSDESGRIYFAFSPYADPEQEGSAAKARIMAWHPDQPDRLQTVAESVLPVRSMALSESGVLASRLYMPNYEDGYYLSLNRLPKNESATAEAAGPVNTQPSILIPAELTEEAEPSGFCFHKVKGESRLLVTCPRSKRLIEIFPEEKETGIWQGAMILRESPNAPLRALCNLGGGKILGGGPEGFVPLERDENQFRIEGVRLTDSGVEINLSKPIDRFTAVKPESYSVKAIPLQGGGEQNITIPEPVIESNGKSVLLQSEQIPQGCVLRVKCLNLPSEVGEPLENPVVFFTIHRR